MEAKQTSEVIGNVDSPMHPPKRVKLQIMRWATQHQAGKLEARNAFSFGTVRLSNRRLDSLLHTVVVVNPAANPVGHALNLLSSGEGEPFEALRRRNSLGHIMVPQAILSNPVIGEPRYRRMDVLIPGFDLRFSIAGTMLKNRTTHGVQDTELQEPVQNQTSHRQLRATASPCSRGCS